MYSENELLNHRVITGICKHNPCSSIPIPEISRYQKTIYAHHPKQTSNQKLKIGKEVDKQKDQRINKTT